MLLVFIASFFRLRCGWIDSFVDVLLEIVCLGEVEIEVTNKEFLDNSR